MFYAIYNWLIFYLLLEFCQIISNIDFSLRKKIQFVFLSEGKIIYSETNERSLYK